VIPLLPKRARTRRQRSLTAPLIAAAALTSVAMVSLASLALMRRSRARRC
jgi:hypothetical protein